MLAQSTRVGAVNTYSSCDNLEFLVIFSYERFFQIKIYSIVVMKS